MSQLFNQFSYPLIALGSLALLFVVLGRFASRRTLIAIELAAALFFIVGFVALRTGQGDAADVANYEDIVGNGRPTFVEFFSDYCTSCLVLKPAVDDLVLDILPDFNVLRVNVHSDIGQAMVDAYGFRYTPEFVLLDTSGDEIWRGHALPDDDWLTDARAE